MSKIVAAGVTALFVAASPLAHAQAPSSAPSSVPSSAPSSSPSSGDREHLTATDLAALTDARINIVKAALQLTPDQEKYWPPIEDAIRARVKNRQARIESVAKRVERVRERGAIEAIGDRDPVAFLHRRADALAQRTADLKKLAAAWQPLYQTLTPDQKRRMGFLTIVGLREIKSGLEQRQTTMGLGQGMGMWAGTDSDGNDED